MTAPEERLKSVDDLTARWNAVEAALRRGAGGAPLPWDFSGTLHCMNSQMKVLEELVGFNTERDHLTVVQGEK